MTVKQLTLVLVTLVACTAVLIDFLRPNLIPLDKMVLLYSTVIPNLSRNTLNN